MNDTPTPRTIAQAANLKIIMDAVKSGDLSNIDIYGAIAVLVEEVLRLQGRPHGETRLNGEGGPG